MQIPDEYKNTVFEPIAKKLETKDSLFSTDINPLAENPEFRQDLFYLLTHYHREDLFPQKYYSFESAAESNMVNWLQHPNELDTIPSEIALAGKETITEGDSSFIYYVFKFKTSPPHWAAKDGWMFGCVGPFCSQDSPYTWAKATFSRFSSVDTSSSKKEALWNHKHVYRDQDE